MEDWYRDVLTYASDRGGSGDHSRLPVQHMNSTSSDDFSGECVSVWVGVYTTVA